MIKKVITYTDYNGNKTTEAHYFHLNMPQLLEFEAEYPEGLEATVTRATANNDVKTVLNMIKLLITRSYGVRSEDGKQFRKSKELSDEFVNSEAYSELFTELMTDADAAAKFVNGIMPSDFEEKAAKILAQSKNLSDDGIVKG